jgi:glucose-1-phosphate cytidylyltransferase
MGPATLHNPKPMVDLGGRPLIWHVMSGLAAQGVDEFILALGYRAEAFKHYFLHYRAMTGDLTVDLRREQVTLHRQGGEPWLVHLVDTGLETGTGGRLKRLAPWIGDTGAFLFTYGDCLGDVDLAALLACHRRDGRLATMTAVRTGSPFGVTTFDGDRIAEFREKPDDGSGWVNGGYFVLERAVLDMIDGDDTAWERGPLERLVRTGQLTGYRHAGFWRCVDTPEDLVALEDLWRAGKAPWLSARGRTQGDRAAQ